MRSPDFRHLWKEIARTVENFHVSIASGNLGAHGRGATEVPGSKDRLSLE